MIKRIVLLTLLLANTSALFGSRFQNQFSRNRYSSEAKIVAVGLAIIGWYTIRTGLVIAQTPSHAGYQIGTIRYLADRFSNVCIRLIGLGIATGGSVLFADGTNIIYDNQTIVNYKKYFNQLT